MSQALFPHIPEKVPLTGNRFTRFVGRNLLRLIGWRVVGDMPNRTHLVICVAPHTSNWDFIIGMFVSLAMGVKFSYFMKKEAFFWPMKGPFMKMGGIPIDRRAAQDTVGQAVKWFKEHDDVWLAITPEGTRSKVDKYKTGFVRIAHEAGVPIFSVCFHYPDKTLNLDRLWETTGDYAADCEKIREHINANYQGAHPERQ